MRGGFLHRIVLGTLYICQFPVRRAAKKGAEAVIFIKVKESSQVCNI